jgi:hypothetical protein
LLLQGLRYADAPAEGFPRYRYSGDARCLQERRSYRRSDRHRVGGRHLHPLCLHPGEVCARAVLQD